MAARPDEGKWIMWRGCKAEFGQAGDNLYINAAGKQHQYTNDRSNHMHYGILFARNKAEGDFDATVRVEYEAYTTPYALHGIIVKNTLDTLWDNAEGTVFCGAMSSRGFMCMQFGGALDKDTPRAPLGGPEAPYWFKVEKRGEHFNCFYSEDERKTWKKHMGATMGRAAREQFVGLVVNSCTPDLRLVKFTDFEIVLVRP